MLPRKKLNIGIKKLSLLRKIFNLNIDIAKIEVIQEKK